MLKRWLFGMTAFSLVMLAPALVPDAHAESGSVSRRYIVTVGEEKDSESVIRSHGLSSLQDPRYHRTLRGFSARLTHAQLRKLENDHRVASVHPEGTRFIVTLHASANPDQVVSDHRVRPHSRHVFRRTSRGFAVELNAHQISRLENDSRVRAVEPDGFVEKFSSQTIGDGLVRMGRLSWPYAPRLDGSDQRIDVGVAVLDTGIDLNHPDLNVVHHVGFVGIQEGQPGYDGDDFDGHGTHVAGIIGALDNDIGVVGMAPGARLWSVQVVAPTAAQSTWSNVIAGFEYVDQHSDEIQVANCSFGSVGKAPVAAIQAAVSALVGHGVVVVAAVGNGLTELFGRDSKFGTADDVYPAALPEVMAVSAIDPLTDIFDPQSNYSPTARSKNFVNSPGGAIDVAAPGMNILSTYTGGGYATLSGSSMAAPHVAGLVALKIAAFGRAHNASEVYSIRQRIVEEAIPQSDWRTAFQEDPDEMPEPLAVIPSLLFNQSITPYGMKFSITSWPGYTETVQYSSGLGSNVWTDLTTLTGTGDTLTVTDPPPTRVVGQAVSMPAFRFYRVKSTPIR